MNQSFDICNSEPWSAENLDFPSAPFGALGVRAGYEVSAGEFIYVLFGICFNSNINGKNN